MEHGKTYSFAVLAFVVLAVAALALAEPARAQEAPPEPGAAAWTLVDADSGEALAGEEASEELPIASTTKVMAALVVFEEGTDLDEEVTVPESAAEYARPPFSNVGLRAGDRLTVRELLTAAMLESGNDAAYALAGHVGGGPEEFVRMMNRSAEEHGLRESHFENPVGLDDPDHRSSARDLAEIARLALDYPELREILGTRSAVIDAGSSASTRREIPLQNTNELLGSYPPATGVKTGTTPAAGESLVASASAGDESYVNVFLDAEDRFGAAAEGLEYGFSAYDRRAVIEEGRAYSAEPLPSRPEPEVWLAAGEEAEALVANDAGVEHRVEVADGGLPGFAERGERLGSVVAEVDGERVAQAPLVAAEDYEEASMWRKLWYTAGGIFGGGG